MCAATAAERSSASSPCLRCKSPPDPDDCQALEPTARVYTGFVDEAPPGGLGKIEHEAAPLSARERSDAEAYELHAASSLLNADEVLPQRLDRRPPPSRRRRSRTRARTPPPRFYARVLIRANRATSSPSIQASPGTGGGTRSSSSARANCVAWPATSCSSRSSAKRAAALTLVLADLERVLHGLGKPRLPRRAAEGRHPPRPHLPRRNGRAAEARLDRRSTTRTSTASSRPRPTRWPPRPSAAASHGYARMNRSCGTASERLR